MNLQKLVVIVVAIAINCAVLLWFHAWSAAVVANAAASAPRPRVTLPVINVHPSAAQWRQLRQAPAASASAQAAIGSGGACLAMPYYAFASSCDPAVSG